MEASFLAGGLVPTFLVSRILFWELRSLWVWGGVKKLLFVNVIALLIAGLLAGAGMADAGAFMPLRAIAMYLIPQAV